MLNSCGRPQGVLSIIICNAGYRIRTAGRINRGSIGLKLRDGPVHFRDGHGSAIYSIAFRARVADMITEHPQAPLLTLRRSDCLDSIIANAHLVFRGGRASGQLQGGDTTLDSHPYSSIRARRAVLDHAAILYYLKVEQVDASNIPARFAR